MMTRKAKITLGRYGNNNLKINTMAFKNQVTEQRFLEWYFTDSDDMKYFGARIVNEIIKNGSMSISSRQLFDECAFIPGHICVNNSEEEYNPREVVFIEERGYPNEKLGKGWHTSNS